MTRVAFLVEFDIDDPVKPDLLRYRLAMLLDDYNVTPDIVGPLDTEYGRYYSGMGSEPLPCGMERPTRSVDMFERYVTPWTKTKPIRYENSTVSSYTGSRGEK